jgi:PAS domain S-box-containing protein
VTNAFDEHVADDAPVLLLVLDEGGRCTWCSRPWQEFTGRNAAEAVGAGWLAALHPEDRDRLEKLITEAAAFELEARVRRADGRFRRLLTRAAPRERAGKFSGYVFAATDVTEWREAEELLRFLTDLGDTLSGSLELDETARIVADRVVPVFADAALVALARPDGQLRCAAVRHVDAAREETYRERATAAVADLDEAAPLTRAFGARQPVLIEDLTAEMNGQGRPDRATLSPTLPVDAQSTIAVPFLGADTVHGVLLLAFAGSDRHYGASDLALAQDIARRSSVALERANAYDQERRLAETLQRSLLPDALPDVPGMAFCARYLPGSEVDVGGDWYDVIPLHDGKYGVAIGDVAGHGVHAATVMGQLRHALRAFAADGYEPAAALQRLNRFVFDQGPADMATLCYGVLNPRRGTLDYAAAGHPPPLLIPADGAPRFAEGLPAPPIGADPHSWYTSTELRLDPGTTLLFFTDGLVERRGESLDVGLARLADHATFTSPVLDEACDDLLLRLLEGERPSDDVALLSFRFVGARRGPMRIRRPARAVELAPVRRLLSAWLEASGVAPEEIGAVSVAVSEAATNAIEHAYGPGEGWFEVEAEMETDALTIRVRDGGRWRPKARGGGGRGLGLIGRMMDEFELRRADNGTEVWMRRSLRGQTHT